ncbi:hypothetical protein DRO69_07995, partial [Candidatus Bathyarchaeota archaeon]
INTTAPPPPPFPPPPPDAKIIGSKAGYVMYDYDQLLGSPNPPALLPGTAYPTTGYWDEITEVFVPLPSTGFGDYMTNDYYGGPAPLVTIEVTSKNDTQGSLIDLLDVKWLDGNNVWHDVDVVVDGYYGTPPAEPSYSSAIGSGPIEIDLTNPIGTTWHELYPHYSNILTLTSWEDNGDGVLSASDQIDLLNQTDGWIYWYHVDAVTTTIHWTFEEGQALTGTGSAEPNAPLSLPKIKDNPTGSYWHEIYPNYSKRFKITSWEDDGDGVLSASDRLEILYEEGFTAPPFPPPTAGPYWIHIDSVSTDLIWSFKSKEQPVPEFPLGLGLIMAIAPAISIAYLWRLRKKVVAK